MRQSRTEVVSKAKLSYVVMADLRYIFGALFLEFNRYANTLNK